MTRHATGGGPWWAARDQPGDGTCGICGTPLDSDPDDVAAPPQGPICGACARARAFDQTLWELDLADPDAGLW